MPIALGLAWLPSLRRASPQWLAAFMALTAGLLTFLALEALSEALELQAALPGELGGTGLVLLGVAAELLALTACLATFAAAAAERSAASRSRRSSRSASGCTTSAKGSRSARRSRSASSRSGASSIVGFMVHNVTEGLGIAAPIADRGRGRLGRLAGLALIAGAPAILGAWIGGFLTSDLLGVLFFAVAAGAALEVVVEVARYVARQAPGGLGSRWVVGGFLAGIAVMYLTGLLI